MASVDDDQEVMDCDNEKNDRSDASSDVSSSDDEMEDNKNEELIKELKEQVKTYPANYNGHVQLIKLLRDSGELIEARTARENMNKYYPLSPELWLEWIKDEQSVCCTKDERAFISSLLDRASKEYTSIDVWTEYLVFSIGDGDVEAAQDIANRALSAVGTHVRDGDLIWQTVLMMEKQVYSGLSENPPAQEKQKKRIQQLLRRRLAVSVMNMDKATLLEEAEEWFDGPLEPYMVQTLKKSLQKLSTLLPYEDQLMRSEEDEAANVEAFQDYLNHLLEAGDPISIQHLYERAVARHPLSVVLWLDYTQYCLKQFPTNTALLESVCERSVLNCLWSGDLFEQYLRVLQRDKDLQQLKDLQPKIISVVERCLGSLGGADESTVAKASTCIWRSYLVYLIHCIEWSKLAQNKDEALQDTDETIVDKKKQEIEVTKELQRFRDACSSAVSMIRDTSLGKVQFDADVEICRLAAAIEAKAGCLSMARAHWDDILSQAGYTGRHDLWLEFITLERRHGTLKHTRKLFKRALERVWYNTEVIAAEYRLFEEVEGDVKTLDEFFQRYSARMKLVMKKREGDKAKEEAKIEQERALKKNNKQKKKQKNSEARDAQDKSSEPTEHKDQVSSGRQYASDQPEETLSPPPSKRPRTEPQQPHSNPSTTIAPPPGFSGKVSNKSSDLPMNDGSPTKKRKVETAPVISYPQEKVKAGEESRTAFVSNLSYETPLEDVTAAFIDCGKVVKASLVPDFKGRSKGFGYVTFDTRESLENALKKDRMLVCNRPMFISKYETEKKTGHKFQYPVGEEKDKLFVRGLPFAMTEQQIKEAFEVHGPITETRLATHRNGYSKGICFIKFASSDDAEKARKAMDQTELKGSTITVLISNPSQAKANNAKKQNSYSDVASSSGAIKPGARKPTVAFLPRALAKGAAAKPADVKSNETSSITPKSNEDFRKLFK